MFRGQSKDYPLVPSGRRRPVPRGNIWAHYSRRMIMYLQQQGPNDDFEQEAQLWLVWLQALAQHYGAGSNYLDVTHDLGIATWFAFHRSSTASLKTVVGPPGDSADDSVVRTDWIRLKPHAGPAYVYVLDLEIWETEGLPKTGQIVDLADAPTLFHSPRIQVQSGCLAWAEKDEDLKAHAVCEFTVDGAAFEQSPYKDWSVEQIFPPPAEDTWYARFLSLPFLVDSDQPDQTPSLSQSLPVTLFLSSAQSPYVADVRSRFRYLLPPLVHRELHPAAAPAPESGSDDARLLVATKILLEGPQISAHPPVGDRSWNHEVLLSDWSPRIDVFDLDGKPSGSVDVDNALVEFSPLDQIGWHEGEPINDAMLRGVWIERRDAELAAYLFVQDYPMPSFRRVGPLSLRLGPGRRLEYWRRRQKSWAEIEELDRYGKAIVAALVLLRDCSPLPKISAYPTLQADDGGDGCNMLFPLSASAARLFRAASSDPPWYVLRHPGGEPYTTAEPNLGSLTLNTKSKTFAEISAREIRSSIESEMRNRS